MGNALPIALVSWNRFQPLINFEKCCVLRPFKVSLIGLMYYVNSLLNVWCGSSLLVGIIDGISRKSWEII